MPHPVMILKLGAHLEWKPFTMKTVRAKAIRMNEEFLFETKSGWIQGHKGQWLIEMGENIRCNLDHESFVRCYKPVGGSVDHHAK